MIFDLIIVLVFVLIVIAGISKGAVRMILGLLSSFVSFLAASWLGKLLAGVLYNAFGAPAVENAVRDSLATASDTVQSLPGWAQSALHLSGKEIAGGGAAAQLTNTVDGAVRPIAEGFAAIILTLLLYFVISLILHKLVIPMMMPKFRSKLSSAADKLVGGVFGAFEAIVIIWMLAYTLKLVLPYIDSDVSFLNESTIYNSFIFYHFYSGNIFTILASWIG